MYITYFAYMSQPKNRVVDIGFPLPFLGHLLKIRKSSQNVGENKHAFAQLIQDFEEKNGFCSGSIPVFFGPLLSVAVHDYRVVESLYTTHN
jgi:hypothetical protein